MFTQRKHPRIPMRVQVTVWIGDDGFLADSDEIGQGGMALVTSRKLAISQPLELEFDLPEGPRVQIPGVVWWLSGGRIGIRFDMREQVRDSIAQWIKQRMEHAKFFAKPI